MIDNEVTNLKGPIKFLSIEDKNIEKVKELLNENDIPFNNYENAHEILCEVEAKHAVEMMKENNPDINVNKNMENLIMNSAFQTFKNSIKLENGMYDNDYIYEVKNDLIENVKKIIIIRDATDQLSKEYNIEK